jgi:hypothetical protein
MGIQEACKSPLQALGLDKSVHHYRSVSRHLSLGGRCAKVQVTRLDNMKGNRHTYAQSADSYDLCGWGNPEILTTDFVVGFQARVNVPDDRFLWLCDAYKPKSMVPAFLEIVDIAGLVRCGLSSFAFPYLP